MQQFENAFLGHSADPIARMLRVTFPPLGNRRKASVAR
jgi:hypothetical protein